MMSMKYYGKSGKRLFKHRPVFKHRPAKNPSCENEMLRMEALEPRQLLTVALSFAGGVPAFAAPELDPASMQAGNFNGDVYPDLAIGNYVGNGTGPGEVKILLNNGHGGFTQSDSQPTDSVASRRLLVVDLNNDGKSDVVTMPRNNVNRLSILLGNGNGTLQPVILATVTSTIANPRITDIAAADFNGDGNMDLVVCGNNMPLVVMLGNGLGAFPNHILITPGGQYTLTTGDVNNDGKMDIIASHPPAYSIEVYLGLGNGNFANPILALPGGPTADMVLTDLNGDGKKDLAIAETVDPNDLSQGVRVLTGDGQGNFSFKYSYNPGVPGDHIAVADFDGDFIPDLAQGWDGASVVFHSGKGDGTFKRPATFENYPNLFSFTFAVADFNHDGKPDVVVPMSEDVYPNEKLIFFANNSQFHNQVSGRVYNDFNGNQIQDQFESGLAGRTVYADLNDDGMLDFNEDSAVTDANGNYRLILPPGTHLIRQVLPADWYQTTPANLASKTGAQIVTVGEYQIVNGGNFGATQLGSISGRVYYDQTANGYSDDSDPGLSAFLVYVDSNLNGSFNPGEPSATTNDQGQYTISNLFPASYALRVVKPSGWEQVSPAPPAGQIDAPFNTRANGGFDSSYTDFGIIYPSFVSGKVFNDTNGDGIQANTGEPGLAQFFVFVDLNSNGLPDLSEPYAQTDASGNYRLRSPSSGTYQVKVLRPSGWQSTVPATGARTVDLVATSEVANQNFGLTQGALNNAGFKTPINLPSGTGSFSDPSSVVTGDFNNDGKQDFVSANNSSDLTIYLNNGAGGFTSASAGFAGSSMRQVIAGYFNADNFLDLAVANQDDGDVSVLLGNGNGTFKLHVDYPAVLGSVGLVAGDFNQDNKMDLVVAGKATDQLALLRGNGDGTFAAAANIANVFGAVAVAAGDINGDHKLDLVSANGDTGNVSILLGNDNGTFAAPSLLTTGIVTPVALVLMDLNNDNILDLAVANEFSDNVRVKLGVGNGTFQTGASFGVGSTPQSIAVGDFDGDGKPDLAVACESDGTTDISGGISILRNLGAGNFDSPLTSTAHTSPRGVAVADFNGDTLPDLAAANFYSDDVSVMINDRGAQAISISGQVFSDQDSNGIKAAAEPGIAGQTVYIDSDNSNSFTPGDPTAITDANGQFLFPPLPPGSYLVRQVTSPNWSQTLPAGGAGQQVTLAAGQSANITFGLHDVRKPALFNANFAVNNGPMKINLVFDENLGNTLSAAKLQLTNLTTGQVITQSALSTSFAGGFFTASFTFPSFTSASLPDGNYRAVIPLSAVTDASGNPLAADVVLDFFALAGDANRDRAVNFADLVAVAQHYGAASGKTFADGDFNFDGLVNFADLVVVAQKYGKTLPPPAPAGAPPVPAAASLPVKPASIAKPATAIKPSTPIKKRTR
jgi:hypothetical protein